MTASPPGRRRAQRPVVQHVQRPTAEFPIVHLEAEIPRPRDWSIAVDGLVRVPVSWSIHDVNAMPAQERVWDLHCVWGWTRPAVRWSGIPAERLIDGAGPLEQATHVMARQIEGPYASCLTLAEARASLLATGCDGEELSPEHGGPLRLVTPPGKWGYKHVKWIGRLTLISHFIAGFWEDMVGNPHGDIPFDRLDLRYEQ